MMPISPEQAAIKRAIDVIASFAALVILFPFLLFIALAVRLTSPGPALFRQRRLGKDSETFTLLKFRTMYYGVSQRKAPDGSNVVVNGDPRITPFGRFLRAFSLDELPQFINVLKGEMSIVGPRPDQLDHLGFYEAEDRRKLAMKPGLTSLAMVRGRNILPWKERIRLEVRYVENYSLWLDVKIMLRTIPVMLLRQGIHVEPEALSHEGEDCE